ncbi:MAG: IS1634 family transposase, partial [Trichodesmium sp. St15_bin1_1]|nr:IS1634 family transposase [Trichodesmium sp. St15_bin1_1]
YYYSNPIVESKSNRDFSYKVQVKVGLRELKIELEKKRAGRFILATNVLDKMELTTHTEVLSKYKGQQLVERGFRFLKDPLFLTDSVFLKSPLRN